MGKPCVQDVSFPECESSHVGKLSLQLNCNSDCIHVLRSMVAVMTARAGMTELRSNRVAIAVDELFANIVSHAYEGNAGRVELETNMLELPEHGQVLIFDFRDFASKIWSGNIHDIANQPSDFDNLCPGGLGLKLICSVSDCCEHTVLENGNHWRLIFNIEDGENDGCNA